MRVASAAVPGACMCCCFLGFVGACSVVYCLIPLSDHQRRNVFFVFVNSAGAFLLAEYLSVLLVAVVAFVTVIIADFLAHLARCFLRRYL